jgi:Tfp pilus assembly protein PilO
MPFIHRTWNYLALSLIVFLCAAGAYGYVFYLIKEKNTRVSTLKNEIEFSVTREAQLQAARATLENTVEERAALDRYLLTDDSVVAFIESLEGLSVVTGAAVEVSAVDEVAEGTTEQSANLEFTLTTRGTWSELMHTLSLVESLPYRTEIVNVNVRKVQGDDVLPSEAWASIVKFHATKLLK